MKGPETPKKPPSSAENSAPRTPRTPPVAVERPGERPPRSLEPPSTRHPSVRHVTSASRAISRRGRAARAVRCAAAAAAAAESWRARRRTAAGHAHPRASRRICMEPEQDLHWLGRRQHQRARPPRDGARCAAAARVGVRREHCAFTPARAPCSHPRAHRVRTPARRVRARRVRARRVSLASLSRASRPSRADRWARDASRARDRGGRWPARRSPRARAPVRPAARALKSTSRTRRASSARFGRRGCCCARSTRRVPPDAHLSRVTPWGSVRAPVRHLEDPPTERSAG